MRQQSRTVFSLLSLVLGYAGVIFITTVGYGIFLIINSWYISKHVFLTGQELRLLYVLQGLSYQCIVILYVGLG